MSHLIRIIGISLAAIGILGTFQNCSGQRSFFPNRLAYTPIEKIQEDFVQTYQGHFTTASCQVSAAYICDQEVFSATLAREDIEADFACLQTDGGEICPSGLIRNYNSSASTAEQEYEQFYCYYNLADMDGVYPVQSSGDTYMATIQSVYDLCMELASR